MGNENVLANLLAKRFIARQDAKAVQYTNGTGYSPHTTTGKHDGERIPWRREDLIAHLTGKKTFGHYLLNTDNTCKLFAFDIDLEKKGWLPRIPMSIEDYQQWSDSFDNDPCNPREQWLNRSDPARDWMKLQFRTIAHRLAAAITEELGLPVAAAYSGSKGIHVYGFTGPIPAADAREAAMIVLDSMGCFEPLRGEHFFRHKNPDPIDGFPNLSIEVFPKQDSLDGKDLGNLMRLPLGRNMKTTDPTFFIDLTSAMNELKPIDPEFALTTSTPWKRPGE